MLIAVTATNRQGGFSLLEVVVAVFILATSLIGLAGLQSIALKNNTGGYNYTQAVQGAYDIIDRIRANPAGRNSYTTSSNGSQNNSCLSTAGCSASAMAGHDLFEWHRLLGQNLPGTPTAGITRSGDVFTVTITWLDWDNDNKRRDNQTLTMDFRL